MRNGILGLVGSGLVVGGAALAMWGCGSEDCNDTGSCGTFDGTGATGGTSGDSGLGGNSGSSGTGGISGAGGTGGTGGSGGDAATCDTTKSPSEEACLVDDQYGIFVSPSGSDSADGSKGTPVQSWEKALELGKAASKFVIACNDDFTTAVSLSSAHSGTKLYGGFKCADWSYEASKKTRLVPSAQGVALTLDGLVGFHAEDVIVEAKDATAAGTSSIAVFANASSNITLRRVDVVAGKGAAGANGVTVPFTFPTQTALNGNSAVVAAGGALKTCNCPGGKQTIGGQGGNGVPANGQSGSDGQPPLGGGKGGTSGTPTDCGNGGTGKSGAPAPATPAALGASTLGTLTSAGWTPSKGTDGAVGAPGQGGGGGASTATSGAGGGGCGSCGGASGPAGKGGGSSIALLLLDTPITLDDTVTLTTADAGKGGNGAAGQNAQTEVGFFGNGVPLACPGGAGAPGAAGGAGGGAAGGVSAGILWKGAAAPVVDSGTVVTFGAKGTKGVGGKAGSNDGIDGDAQAVMEVK